MLHDHAGGGALILRFATILVIGTVVAGCAEEVPASDPTPDTPEIRMGSAVREFAVPPGDTFGALLVHFDPTESRPGDPSAFGIAARTNGFSEDSFVRAFALSPGGAEYVLGAAAGAMGDGAFAVATAGETDAPLLFLFLIHAPTGGTLDATAWTRDPPEFERQFDLPRVNGTWTAAGGSEISYYLQNAAGPLAYNVTVEALTAPGGAGLVAGSVTLSTEHRSPSSGLEISTSSFRGIAGAGFQRVSWSNGESTTEKTIPAIGAPTSGASGFRIVGHAEGPNSLQVETGGGAAAGTLFFEHYSLGFRPDDMGIGIAPMFAEGSLVSAPFSRR